MGCPVYRVTGGHTTYRRPNFWLVNNKSSENKNYSFQTNGS